MNKHNIAYKRLTYAFWLNLVSWLFLFIVINFDVNALSTLILVILIVTHIAYIYFLGDVISLTKKSPFMWGLAAMFFPLGTIITYYLFKAYAIENGWEGWEVCKKDAVKKGGFMKYIAIFLNLVLIGFVIFLLLDNGLPNNAEDYFPFFIITVTPIANLVMLFANSDNSLIGLYFKRKALEEQKKIEQLQGK